MLSGDDAICSPKLLVGKCWLRSGKLLLNRLIQNLPFLVLPCLFLPIRHTSPPGLAFGTSRGGTWEVALCRVRPMGQLAQGYLHCLVTALQGFREGTFSMQSRFYTTEMQPFPSKQSQIPLLVSEGRADRNRNLPHLPI